MSSFDLLNCSRNAFVPDLAIVPREFIRSFSSIPMPLSLIFIVFSLLLTSIFISKGSDVSLIDLFVKAKYFFLSIASDAFEINSLTNISLSE